MINIETEEKVLGLTMVSDRTSNMTYGVRAQYSPESRESMPIVRLTSNYGNATSFSDVKINEINPKRASMREMFALCCHVDERGICDKGSFGTFHIMKQYMKNACKHNICERVRNYSEFQELKLDWDCIANYMKDEFMAAGQYDQYHDCLKLIDMMDYFYTVFHYDENLEREKYKKRSISFERISDVVAKESFCLGEKDYTLQEWKEFLNKYERIGDAISAMMRKDAKKYQ